MSGVADVSSGGGIDFGRLEPGFADPVQGAQACFRSILDASAHPGSIVEIPAVLAGSPPPPMGIAAAAVALTLCDIDTPVWLDAASTAASSYLAFHCGAPFAPVPGDARFAFIAEPSALPPLAGFALGSDEYPERSATLVIEIAGLVDGSGPLLRGPGIRNEARLGTVGLPARFWTERAMLAELFPRGIDVLFVSGGRLAALPRSIQIAL